MSKKDFFSKLKNYNNELEQILEKKEFSSDIRNLLLSMFYKIEISYKDYQKVKRVTKEKNELMEQLIQVIEKDCKKIELVEPNSGKGKVLRKYNLHSISDLAYKKIVSYPVEADFLYAIADLERKYYYISEDYYIENKTFEKMLKMGYCMDLKEIIRDFSGWSWKVEVNEIENTYYNLIYQNLRLLVGNKFLEEWKKNNQKDEDYILKLKERLSHLYGTQNAVILFKKMYIALSLIMAEKNKKFKEELEQENKKALDELEAIKDKAKYLDKLTKDKKEMTKQIKNIDELLNNEKLLEQELERRKERNDKKSKILNIQYLKALLNGERRALIEKMQKNTSLMNPKKYVANKQRIQEKNEIINEILETLNKTNAYDTTIELQKQFLKCIETKVKNTNNKKDIIELIYSLRYYVQLPITKEQKIKSLDNLRMQINKIQEVLIAKCINLKIINTISMNSEINFKIIKNILLSTSVNLEELEVQIEPKYNKLRINLYEGEEMENSFEIETEGSAEKVNIKNYKKFKLFI